MANRKVVVIGAGPGGLAAALQLRHAGADVTVLEARDQVGGRCASHKANGFTFDTGPTFYLYPRILKEIFASIGRDIDQEIPMKRIDPQYRISFDGNGHLDCTPNLEAMDAQIRSLSPRDAGAVFKYISDNRIKLQKFRPILESPFNSMRDLLRPSLALAAPLVKPWKSLGKDLQSYFKDPRLVIAFSFQAKYLGMSPFMCPSLFSILSFLEYEYGIYHPYGGCGFVSQRMADIASEEGADIRLSEPVRKLHFKGKRVVALETDKERYETDAVVINADFAQFMTKLVPNHLRRKWSDAKISKKRFSCSTFMMYLGVEGTYPQQLHHTIHIAKDYRKNLHEIEQAKVLPEDPSIYIHNPSIVDPSLAPAGHSSLYVLVPVPHISPNTPWTPEEIKRYRELTLDKMERFGFDGIRNRIRYEKIVSPIEWRDEFEVYQGATFNLAHNLKQMLHRRPHNKFEDLDGVYLVGGGTHPGSGLPVIYESSRITCKQLLPDIGLSPQFIYQAGLPS